MSLSIRNWISTLRQLLAPYPRPQCQIDNVSPCICLVFWGHIVHTCVSKMSLLWENKGTTKIAQNNWKCFLQRATNVTRQNRASRDYTHTHTQTHTHTAWCETFLIATFSKQFHATRRISRSCPSLLLSSSYLGTPLYASYPLNDFLLCLDARVNTRCHVYVLKYVADMHLGYQCASAAACMNWRNRLCPCRSTSR